MTLEAQSDTSGPFLSFNNPDAGGASHYKMGDANSGPASILASHQGTPSVLRSTFGANVQQAYYLNLSVPVFGIIYVGSAATTAGADSMDVKVIVRHGDRIVGGETVTHNAAAAQKMGRWLTIPLNFRAEVAALEAGKPLTVEVTRVSGLSDFHIGTAGNAQSFVEFRYFNSNPLAGTIFLDRGRFTSSSGEGVSEDEFQRRLAAFQESGGWEKAPPGYVRLPELPAENDGAGVLAFIAFGSLLSLGIVLPRRRLPGKPLVAVLLVLSIVSAGCFGGKADAEGGPGGDDGEPTPTVNQTIEPAPELGEFGNGNIEGFVHDEVGIAVKGAHVAILGTHFFGRTDAKGLFRFENISAGSYILRVDADKFAPLEQEIQVEAAAITRLDIGLVYPSVKQANDKAHSHDDWGDQLSAVFADDSFSPNTQVATTTTATGATWYCDAVTDRESENQNRKGCETKIPIKMAGRKIFPGTSTVEVTLRWTATGNAPKELGLRVVTTTNKTNTQAMVQRAPNTPFNLAIFPNEVDPGHQKFSTWEFYVTLPYTDVYHPGGPLYYSGGSISYTIKLHKGVVPFEPAHRDFWGGATELPLTLLPAQVTGTSGYCYPHKTSGWTLHHQSLIPPGTKEVRGYIAWTHTYLDPAAAVQNTWGLSYIPANGPRDELPFQHATMSANGTLNRNFVLTPKADEVDQFYQFVSNWYFSPNDGGSPGVNGANCYASTAYATKFTLFAVAVKDPDFKDSS